VHPRWVGRGRVSNEPLVSALLFDVRTTPFPCLFDTRLEEVEVAACSVRTPATARRPRWGRRQHRSVESASADPPPPPSTRVLTVYYDDHCVERPACPPYSQRSAPELPPLLPCQHPPLGVGGGLWSYCALSLCSDWRSGRPPLGPRDVQGCSTTITARQ